MSDGTIWVWGKDQKNKPTKLNPERIPDVGGIADIAAGKFYTIVMGSDPAGGK
jgi:hypothetical protein